VDCDAAICLVYGIRSDAGYSAVGRFFVFLRSALPQGLARVFGSIWSHHRDDVSPTRIKEGDALRGGAISLDLGAVAFLLLPREQRPSTNQLRLRLGGCTPDSHRLLAPPSFGSAGPIPEVTNQYRK
jgi:hypothetical protein